ncbi:MAG: hypothetical protein ACI92W_002240 [Paraglaciecola sp.]|jgi:hypothetical protein
MINWYINSQLLMDDLAVPRVFVRATPAVLLPIDSLRSYSISIRLYSRLIVPRLSIMIAPLSLLSKINFISLIAEGVKFGLVPVKSSTGK